MKLANTVTCFLTFLSVMTYAQWEDGLLVNEFSNGSNGNEEFVELMVVTEDCKATLDISNWIVDDNNGDFSGGPSSSEGIATGHMRFSNDAQWQTVPRGALIVIYNSADRNINLPADDPTDANNDSVYILPDNSSLLEWCISTPHPGSASYAGCSYSTGSNWSTISLRNGGDAMQTRKPDFSYFHGAGYGSNLNGGPDNIYFSGAGGGMTYQFGGLQEQDYRDQSNWSSSAATNENPGRLNNPDNRTFRKNLASSGTGTLSLNLGSDQDICSGDSVLVQVDPSFQYINWSHDGGAYTSIYLKPSDTTVYVVKALENSCTDTLFDTLIINVIPQGNPSFTAQDSICADENAIDLQTWLSAQADINGTWSGLGVSGSIFSPANLSGWISIRYTVGISPCDSTHLDSIHVSASLNPTFNAPDTLCEKDGVINLNNWLSPSAQIGGVWQGNGVTGSSFNPSGLSGNQIISYSLSNAKCDTTFTESFEVLPDLSANWTAPSALCANSITNLNSYLPGGAAQGGSFSGSGVSGANLNTAGLLDSVLITYTRGAGNCQNSQSHYIKINAISLDSIQSSPSTCNNDGQLILYATGANGPFQYSIDNGSTWQTDSIFNNLSPGTYSAIVMDQVFCQARQNTQVLNILGPQINQLSKLKATCDQDNGVVKIEMQGNSANYLYSIDGVNFQVDSSFSNLASGVYYAYAMDTNSCVDSMQFVLGEIDPIKIDSIQITHASCNLANGRIEIFTNSAPGPQTFFIDGVSSNSTITNLAAGNYLIEVSDSAGCLDSLRVDIQQLGIASFSSIQLNKENCGNSDGSIQVQVNGRAPFLFRINGGNWQLDSNFYNLANGSYTIEIQDSMSCIIDSTINLGEHLAPQILSINIQHPRCGLDNGFISVNAFSDTSMRYSLNGAAYQAGNIFSNLAAGSYLLSILDTLGCATDTTFTLANLTETSYTSSILQISCNGGNDGEILLSLDSVHAPYSISWTPAPMTGQGTSNPSGFSAGMVYLSLRDSLNCNYLDSFLLSEPTPLTFTDSIEHVACFGDSSGSISIQAQGGIAPYQIIWTDGDDRWQRDQLKAGSYTAWIIDANSCSTNVSATIVEPDTLIAIAGSNQTVCYMETFSISASGSGGTAPYTYQWLGTSLNGGGPHDIQLSSDSVFVLELIDSNGCIAALDSVEITVLPPIQAQLTTNDFTPCSGDIVQININASGGNGNFQHLWQGGTPGNNFTYQAYSSGYVYVLTSDGCSPDRLDSIYIDVQELPSMNLNLPPGFICDSFLLALRPNLFNTDSCFYKLSNGVKGSNCGSFTTWLSAAGMYDLTVELYNNEGCADTFNFTQFIEIERSPVANFSIQPSLFEIDDPNIQLINQSVFYAYNVWYIYKDEQLVDSVVGDIRDFLLPLENGLYTVVQKAVSPKGCQVYSSREIKLKMPLSLFIANCFTPNGDNKNDAFGIQGPVEHFHHAQLEVYDRWGKLLFRTQHPTDKWDGYLNGKKIPQGVYAYRLTSQLSESSEINVKKGALTILH